MLALQANLIQLGINTGIKTPVEINGTYDQPTQRGVQAFQLMHGMDEVTGIADHATLAAVQQQASLAIAQRELAQPQAPLGLGAPSHGRMAAPAAQQSATAAKRTPPDLHTQQQSQALEQQRQWQWQQDQQLQLQSEQQQRHQQEQAQRAEDEKSRDAQRDKEQSATVTATADTPATSTARHGEHTQPSP
uniref:peptidoglycan-binding domain-containing protein n=3 Tax=Xanthomonas axonopodis TaxID=53413 RepID=UPI003D77DDE5